MTSSSDESAQSDDLGIADDQLPEDLQPDENPLAEGLDPGESAGDLLEDGKPVEQGSGGEASVGDDSANDDSAGNEAAGDDSGSET